MGHIGPGTPVRGGAARRSAAPGHVLTGKSAFDSALRANPSLALDYIAARPRMALYMQVSAKIYGIYCKYVAPEDIHVYSVDEVFMDVTHYLQSYGMNARELAMTMIRDVLSQTSITATAGIGTNLYLCKIAMDIMAKRSPADADGVRIAELDEATYRRMLWNHRPLTDFWRIGPGYARKLHAHNMTTMGDVARCSLNDEDLLYRLFGVNAELLIDHAWGWESCTIADIKAFRPESNSLSSGQVLHCPYDFEKARLVVREMTDLLVLDLVEKGLVTDQMVLTVSYDAESLNGDIQYSGPVTLDFYGRPTPKHAHGSIGLGAPTSSTRRIMKAVMDLYDRIVNKDLLIRRMYVVADHVQAEEDADREAVEAPVQLNMFTDYAAQARQAEAERAALEREQRQQRAVLEIKHKYGKNAIIRGMNLEEGATAVSRNAQIGGHNA